MIKSSTYDNGNNNDSDNDKYLKYMLNILRNYERNSVI